MKRTPRSALSAAESAPPTATPTCLELFAGAGGLALGLHRAGFRHVGLVEQDAKACDTLKRNARCWLWGDDPSPAWNDDQVFQGDAGAILDSGLLTDIGHVDLLSGGPPCQPFSSGGKRNGHADDRNQFPTAMDYVRKYWPTAVIFENVPGLLRKSSRAYFDYLRAALAEPACEPDPDADWSNHLRRLRAYNEQRDDRQYVVDFQQVNSADFGVPQTRQRVFIVAIRADAYDPADGWVDECGRDRFMNLKPTHTRDALLHSQWVDDSYWKRHSMTPPERPKDVSEGTIQRLRHADLEGKLPWRTVRDALAGMYDDQERPALPHPRDPAAGAFLNHWFIPEARSYKGHTGSLIDRPSKTIKAGVHGVCGGEAMIDYGEEATERYRYYSIREAARMQSFPDDYEFMGARSHAMRHIGNAVAVEVGRVVGDYVGKLARLLPRDTLVDDDSSEEAAARPSGDLAHDGQGPIQGLEGGARPAA